MPIIPAVRKLRHEDMEFEAIRDYQWDPVSKERQIRKNIHSAKFCAKFLEYSGEQPTDMVPTFSRLINTH
jgi:hypothetical protein